MWDSQTKKSLIQRIEDVNLSASGEQRDSANAMFGRFLHVITSPSLIERETSKKHFINDLEILERLVYS